jgi:hypothetical protein
MTFFDPDDYGDAQRAWVQRTNEQALHRERAHYRSLADARAGARLHMLEAAFADMLRQQPDLWGNGFDAGRAAELTLPIIEGII